MRKLKLQVQISLDGFIAGPNGEMDWIEWNWSEDVKQYVSELTKSFDCIILGRRLAQGFIPYWATIAANPADPQSAEGKIFTDTKKVVFTKTLTESKWDNTTLAKEDLADEINALKSQEGKDIIAYGGAEFVSALIKAGLIDEYHLFVSPAAIGRGMAIFKDLGHKANMQLVKSKQFECGIMLLHYEPKRD